MYFWHSSAPLHTPGALFAPFLSPPLAIQVKVKTTYNLSSQKCVKILQSKHCFISDIFQIHLKGTNKMYHYKFPLQMPNATSSATTNQLKVCNPKSILPPHSLNRFKNKNSPAFQTQPCCFQPVSFTTEGRVIEFCLLNRGSLDWIKICGARGYSSGEWRPIMALKRETCIINHPFLSYPWHVRQGNPCLSEHRQ